MGILPKEILMVSKEEDYKYDNMAEGWEGVDESVWMDEEVEPPNDLRYMEKVIKIVVLPGNM